jgi:PAS domain S-box-containing protein
MESAAEGKLKEALARISEQEEKLAAEKLKTEFYRTVADFTFGWELWLDINGTIKYCSPSCYDLTGYTTNQIISAGDLAEFIIYEPDRDKFRSFLSQHVNQLSFSNSLEFRIMTRHRQLCWCSMYVRGVYNKQGSYLGIRASVQEITKLKKAMGFINDISTSREIEQKAKLKFKAELDIKERELISSLLQLSGKNQLLSQLQKSLRMLSKSAGGFLKKELLRLQDSLEEELEKKEDSDELQIQLEKVHPGFIDTLRIKHPQMTQKEIRLCAYVRLGLSSKEISGLCNITPESVEIARVRLRKRLKLPKNRNLKQFLECV